MDAGEVMIDMKQRDHALVEGCSIRSTVRMTATFLSMLITFAMIRVYDSAFA